MPLRNPIVKEDLKSILSDDNIDWRSFEGKTILITGANGFLPAYMVETLLYANETLFQTKATVIGLVRNKEKAGVKFAHHAKNTQLKILAQDVAKPIQIEGDVDYIIHAASQASPRYFFSDPVGTIEANTLGTSNVLRLAQDKKSKSFLYFSSGEVYGNIFETKNIIKENEYGIIDPLFVRNCYAASKMAGEAMCAGYFQQYGVPTKIVRPSHTYGPGFSFDDGRAFASFVGCVINSQNIVLKSDGSACRSFVYLADATRGYFTALLKGENGQAYNVGNDYEISMRTLAETIIRASGKEALKLEFDIDVAAKVSSASMHGLLDIGKLKALGWSPRIKEEEGFSRVLAYFKDLPL